ncbi:MAG: RNA polymerase sigma factor [Candidatus Yanofskybacteria bacterium]|nr:RNA polymerase sigma factor [Candidatus Yanofskybacteria bacterium]
MEEPKEYFSKIYDQYVAQIYRFVYLKTGSQDIAEDLAAEVFVRAWESYQASLGPEEATIDNMRAFLYGIARNIVADHYRREKKVRVVSVEETQIEVEYYSDGLEEQVSVRIEVEKIQRVIVDLPQDYQDLIIWRYLEEMSVPEIAELTGKTEDNVRVGLHRGIKMLREKLPIEAKLAVID